MAASLPFGDIHLIHTYSKVELLILTLITYRYTKHPVFHALTLYYAWVLISDIPFFEFPLKVAVIEAYLFGAWIVWLHKRPERIHSASPSDTVQIGFYYGDKYLPIAKLTSLFGYDVTGIVVIIGDECIKPKWGIIEKTKRRAVEKNHVIIDTHIKPTKEILNAFYSSEGREYKCGCCMLSMKPLLNSLGEDYRVGAKISPACYMEQVLSI